MRWALLLACAGGCSVPLGDVPDAAACAPSTDFFVSDVYPRYLAANQCGSSPCHAFDGGHGVLRLRPPETPPAPGTPIGSWPIGWRENYYAAIHLLRCDAPLESRILTMPEGRDNLHPPGPVVRDRVTAADVLSTWVTR